jgi:hypothetical protein
LCQLRESNGQHDVQAEKKYEIRVHMLCCADGRGHLLLSAKAILFFCCCESAAILFF